MKKLDRTAILAFTLACLLMILPCGGSVRASGKTNETLPNIPVGNITADDYLALKVEGLRNKHTLQKDALGVYQRQAASWITVPGKFTTFKNLKENYGGPASVKAICYFLTGCSASQTSIATALETEKVGTLPARVVEYLNNAQDIFDYQLYTGLNIHQLILNIYEGIYSGRPVMLGVDFSEKDGWPYSAGRARYVVIYGILGDMNHVAISDSYVNYAGIKTTKHYYSVTVEALYAAYIRAGTGLIY